MTNKELLKELLKDRPININILSFNQINTYIKIISNTFKLKQNSISASIYCTQSHKFIRAIGVDYKYLYYNSKKRTIRKTNNEFEAKKKEISYNTFTKLSVLLDENYKLENLINLLKNK